MISIKEAKEISLIKWNGELNETEYFSIISKLNPKAKNHFYCGFCLRHGYGYSCNQEACIACGIGQSEAVCCSESHSLYDQIENEGMYFDEKQELIRQFIQIIENIPDEE